MRASIDKNRIHTRDGFITLTTRIGVVAIERPQACTANALLRGADRALPKPSDADANAWSWLER